jgi:hypothetical protein
MGYHKHNNENDETSQTTTRHSPSYELYLASILLLDQLVYAIIKFQPSSSSWVNIVPKLTYNAPINVELEWSSLDGSLQSGS